jgi:hypothetical protein
MVAHLLFGASACAATQGKQTFPHVVNSHRGYLLVTLEQVCRDLK